MYEASSTKYFKNAIRRHLCTGYPFSELTFDDAVPVLPALATARRVPAILTASSAFDGMDTCTTKSTNVSCNYKEKITKINFC